MFLTPCSHFLKIFTGSQENRNIYVEKRTGKKLILSLQEAPDITFSICVTFHTVMQNSAARHSSRCGHRMGYFVTLLRLSITRSPFSPLTVASNGGWQRRKETCTQQTEHWLSGVPSPRRPRDQQVLWTFSKAAASGEEREKGYRRRCCSSVTKGHAWSGRRVSWFGFLELLEPYLCPVPHHQPSVWLKDEAPVQRVLTHAQSPRQTITELKKNQKRTRKEMQPGSPDNQW